MAVFNDGDFAGIEVKNLTKKPFDATMLLAEYDNEQLVSVSTRNFNDIDKNGFLSMRLDKKQSGESNFKVMLLKDLVNMIPLTNADNILIRSK